MEEAAKTGLKINTSKSKVMRFNAGNHECIAVDGITIDDVDSFTYLGAKMTKEGGGTEDINDRLCKGESCIHKAEKVMADCIIKADYKVEALQDTGKTSFAIRHRNLEDECKQQQENYNLASSMKQDN